MAIPRTLSRILVPIDFSETSGAALDYATFLARSFDARVDLLHVLDPMLGVTGESLLLVKDQPETVAEYGVRIAQEELDRLAARLEGDGVPARALVEPGVPWERIVRASQNADLVVMGTHGRTGLSRVLLGSVTDKVVQRSTTPVLTVRGAAFEAAAAGTRHPATEVT